MFCWLVWTLQCLRCLAWPPAMGLQIWSFSSVPCPVTLCLHEASHKHPRDVCPGSRQRSLRRDNTGSSPAFASFLCTDCSTVPFLSAVFTFSLSECWTKGKERPQVPREFGPG